MRVLCDQDVTPVRGRTLQSKLRAHGDYQGEETGRYDQATADAVARIRPVLAASGKALDDTLAVRVERVADFAVWRGRLEANPLPAPQLWALYHDLTQAELGQRLTEASSLAAELLARDAGQVSRPGTVLTFSPAALGEDAARCAAVVDNDPAHPLGLNAVDDAEVERIAGLLPSARDLLGRVEPSLLDEIDALGHQLLLGVGARAVFGGAASVFLWGAVVLNPTLVLDRIDLIESLAHETAHALLFGLTLGEDLTTNDPAECFSSPLRADPRPIEGIVHATFVLGRMIFALRSLAGATGVGATERLRIAGKIDRNIALYRAGLGVVEAHARFTPAGAHIFNDCRCAMADLVRGPAS